MMTDVYRNEPPRTTALLDAVEAGQIQRSTLGWGRVVVLMRDTREPLKTRARALLTETPGERAAVVTAYADALTETGDVAAGQDVFTRVCSACHQVAGEGGVAFGPDLATVRHWSARALSLIHI